MDKKQINGGVRQPRQQRGTFCERCPQPAGAALQGQLTTIETAKWSPGVYFVRVECVGSTSLTERLVVQR